MPRFEKYSLTGCRPAQLLGPWAIEPQAYDDLYDRAMAIIAANQLEVVARQSAQVDTTDENQPAYRVDDNGVAHFQITGPTTRYPTSMQSVLGGTATLPLQRAVRLAANDGFVKGGFVEINSPGGTVDGATELNAEFAAFRAKKPLRMHVAHQGTSAAMLTGVEADLLTADPMGIIGSVGVLTRMRDTSELMKRMGVKEHYIASGDRKAAGAPGTVITDEQLAEKQKMVDALNKHFQMTVRKRRPKITDTHMSDIARAGLYDSQSALQMGLIDGVMTTDEALTQFTQRLMFGDGRTLPG